MTRLVATVLLLAAVLTGCSGLPESGDKGYVTGTGTVRQLAVADRGEPVELVEEGLNGKPIDLADNRGKPTVVVVWGSWCVECREEQRDVNAAAEQLKGTAEFVGLNVREPSVANALAYEREFDVPYPSIDGNDGRALQAFTGTLKPYTVPAFVVLDAEVRVAATIIGRLPSTGTLVELAEEVAAEDG